jgi:hypothetical protein
VKINDQKYALIKEYPDTWGNMTDAQALGCVNRWLAVDQQVAALRSQYVPIVSRSELSGTSGVRQG